MSKDLTLHPTITMFHRLTLAKEGVTVPEEDLYAALKSDMKTAKRVPTEQECRAMLDHNDEDEDKETPVDIKKLFPKVTEELESAWQLKSFYPRPRR